MLCEANELTDDLGLSPEFLADDSDARAEDEFDGPYGHGKCTCGYRAAIAEARECDYEAELDCFAGCPGCDPIMYDCRPYGFGLEIFELPRRFAEMARVRSQFRGLYVQLRVPGEEVLAAGDAATTHLERRMARAAERKWDAICSRAETHRKAVEEYEAWAKAIA